MDALGDREFVRSALLMRSRMNTMSFSDVLHIYEALRQAMHARFNLLVCMRGWHA
jgi:hypothetical protein